MKPNILNTGDPRKSAQGGFMGKCKIKHIFKNQKIIYIYIYLYIYIYIIIYIDQFKLTVSSE